MSRYSYTVYIHEEYINQFSSINKALNNIDIPIDKKIEIGKKFSLKPKEKLTIKEYVDKETGLKIEVRILH